MVLENILTDQLPRQRSVDGRQYKGSACEYIKIADQFLKEVDADNDGELSQEELNRVRSDLFDGVGHFRFRLGDFPVPPQNIWRFETYPDLLAMVASLLDDIEMEMLGIDLRVNKK